jgi:hypothetical protein
VNVRDLSEVFNKINSGPQFHTYSISVESTYTGSITGAVFVQLTRFDVARDSAVFGPTIPHGVTLLPITDPRFHA